MFSVEVIYSIRILLELEQRKREKGRLRRLGLNELLGNSRMGLKLMRQVFMKLVRKGYIKAVGGKYISSTELDSITLLDLVETLHGSTFCIGESHAEDLKGDYPYRPEFSGFHQVEQEVYREFTEHLKKIKIKDCILNEIE